MLLHRLQQKFWQQNSGFFAEKQRNLLFFQHGPEQHIVPNSPDEEPENVQEEPPKKRSAKRVQKLEEEFDGIPKENAPSYDDIVLERKNQAERAKILQQREVDFGKAIQLLQSLRRRHHVSPLVAKQRRAEQLQTAEDRVVTYAENAAFMQAIQADSAENWTEVAQNAGAKARQKAQKIGAKMDVAVGEKRMADMADAIADIQEGLRNTDRNGQPIIQDAIEQGITFDMNARTITVSAQAATVFDVEPGVYQDTVDASLGTPLSLLQTIAGQMDNTNQAVEIETDINTLSITDVSFDNVPKAVEDILQGAERNTEGKWEIENGRATHAFLQKWAQQQHGVVDDAALEAEEHAWDIRSLQFAQRQDGASYAKESAYRTEMQKIATTHQDNYADVLAYTEELTAAEEELDALRSTLVKQRKDARSSPEEIAELDQELLDTVQKIQRITMQINERIAEKNPEISATKEQIQPLLAMNDNIREYNALLEQKEQLNAAAYAESGSLSQEQWERTEEINANLDRLYTSIERVHPNTMALSGRGSQKLYEYNIFKEEAEYRKLLQKDSTVQRFHKTREQAEQTRHVRENMQALRKKQQLGSSSFRSRLQNILEAENSADVSFVEGDKLVVSNTVMSHIKGLMGRRMTQSIRRYTRRPYEVQPDGTTTIDTARVQQLPRHRVQPDFHTLFSDGTLPEQYTNASSTEYAERIARVGTTAADIHHLQDGTASLEEVQTLAKALPASAKRDRLFAFLQASSAAEQELHLSQGLSIDEQNKRYSVLQNDLVAFVGIRGNMRIRIQDLQDDYPALYMNLQTKNSGGRPYAVQSFATVDSDILSTYNGALHIYDDTLQPKDAYNLMMYHGAELSLKNIKNVPIESIQMLQKNRSKKVLQFRYEEPFSVEHATAIRDIPLHGGSIEMILPDSMKKDTLILHVFEDAGIPVQFDSETP